MKTSDDGVVIKYFDLIDEFIRIRCCTDEVLRDLLDGEVSNKASYRRRIVETCVPGFQSDIRVALEQLEESYDRDVIEELLYQICIDVNPSLEIHQVSLPDRGPGTEGEGDPTIPYPGTGDTAALYRKVLGLAKSLREQVIGQDEAIETLVRSIKKNAVGLKRPTAPVGTFLLVGRTGTGKTELAKALAHTLYEQPGHLVRIDCSEYALPHEYAKLIGSPPGYIGHSEGGFLTESVKKNPNCIVLFDEIEKAHSKVHNLLLQLLDEGVLTDSKGQTIAFDKATVILTSNLGIEKIDAIRTRMGFRASDSPLIEAGEMKSETIDAMRDHFRPEFINRIDEVVVFNALDVKVCTRIANRMLKEVSSLLAARGIEVTFSPSVKGMLARDGFSEDYGARELRRLIKRRIEGPLTDLILEDQLNRDDRIKVRVRNGSPEFSVERAITPQSAVDRPTKSPAGATVR